MNPHYLQRRVAIFNALHASINQGATHLVVIHVTGDAGDASGASDVLEQLHWSHCKDSDAAVLLQDLMKAKTGQHPLVGEGPWLRYFQSCSFRQVCFEHLAEELEGATVQGRYAVVTSLSTDSHAVERILDDFNASRPCQNGMALSGGPYATCLTKPKLRSL